MASDDQSRAMAGAMSMKGLGASRRHVLLGLAGALCLPPRTAAASDAPSPLVVGDAKAARGQVALGVVEVPAGVDPALSMPVIVVNGALPGPVLAITAGAHGGEYASIVAVTRLVKALDPKALRGAVILLPLINVPAFQSTVAHVNPVDGGRMNSSYPGATDGAQSMRAAAAIITEVIERTDYVIDLHGGDLDESLQPYAYWPKTGDAIFDSRTREMVLAFGIDTIVIRDNLPKDPARARTLSETAIVRGKPTIVVEAGYSGAVDASDVHALIAGSISVMRRLDMLDGDVTTAKSLTWVSAVTNVVSDSTGMFFATAKRGARVAQGGQLGYLTDYYGRTLGDVASPSDGVLLYIRSAPSAVKGGIVASVGVLAAREKALAGPS